MTSRVAKPPPAEIPRALTESHPSGRVLSLLTQPWRVFQISRGSLRAKFIIVIVSLQISLMSTVAIVMDRNQREAIMEHTRLRALSLGQSLATLSERYFIGYNFAKIGTGRGTADSP